MMQSPFFEQIFAWSKVQPQCPILRIAPSKATHGRGSLIWCAWCGFSLSWSKAAHKLADNAKWGPFRGL